MLSGFQYIITLMFIQNVKNTYNNELKLQIERVISWKLFSGYLKII